MPKPRRADTNALTSLGRDVVQIAEDALRTRTTQALAGLPSSLVRTVVEQNDAGQVRIGVRNNATGKVAWLTEWF